MSNTQTITSAIAAAIALLIPLGIITGILLAVWVVYRFFWAWRKEWREQAGVTRPHRLVWGRDAWQGEGKRGFEVTTPESPKGTQLRTKQQVNHELAKKLGNIIDDT